MVEHTDTARRTAIEFAQHIQSRHGEEIVILDLREISPVADYFIIATGTSDRQIKSIADELTALGKQSGNPCYRCAGKDAGDWIAMDFFDVVVHLFNSDLRRLYDLELIWGEAPRVELE
jgi:ribosome-associated protein